MMVKLFKRKKVHTLKIIESCKPFKCFTYDPKMLGYIINSEIIKILASGYMIVSVDITHSQTCTARVYKFKNGEGGDRSIVFKTYEH